MVRFHASKTYVQYFEYNTFSNDIFVENALERNITVFITNGYSDILNSYVAENLE